MRNEIPPPPNMQKIKIMQKEAKGCNSCLLWHKHCKAECCKTMLFKVHLNKKPRIGDKIILRMPEITPDMKWYYELHGVQIKKDVLTMKLNRFTYKKGELMVHRTCDNLTNDLKCREWQSGNRPNMCKELNLETSQEERFHITPNCMFKHQK